MKTYQIAEVKKCSKIQCDKCGREAKSENDIEFHEYTTITRSCGYGSGQDDGSTFEVDLCQYCAKNLLSPYWKTKMPEEKSTWDSFFESSQYSQEEVDDFSDELEKSRDSQLPIGMESVPGQVFTSKLNRHFLELSPESIDFLNIKESDNIDISVGDALVTLWNQERN
ncbi:hypothetical protein EYS14_16410 [Alteromonadaceae bacterium M269]|nr:hypothetical protein EYS14_16410 [Alteromonadaceae bacterium M269]